MPIYNSPILEIDVAETRRYAGLKKATNFDERNIIDACEEALLPLNVRGIGIKGACQCGKKFKSWTPADLR